MNMFSDVNWNTVQGELHSTKMSVLKEILESNAKFSGIISSIRDNSSLENEIILVRENVVAEIYDKIKIDIDEERIVKYKSSEKRYTPEDVVHYCLKLIEKSTHIVETMNFLVERRLETTVKEDFSRFTILSKSIELMRQLIVDRIEELHSNFDEDEY